MSVSGNLGLVFSQTARLACPRAPTFSHIVMMKANKGENLAEIWLFRIGLRHHTNRDERKICIQSDISGAQKMYATLLADHSADYPPWLRGVPVEYIFPFLDFVFCERNTRRSEQLGRELGNKANRGTENVAQHQHLDLASSMEI